MYYAAKDILKVPGYPIYTIFIQDLPFKNSTHARWSRGLMYYLVIPTELWRL